VLVDTHCHLGDPQFDDDRPAVVKRAHGMGVGHIVVIADSANATRQAIELALQFGQSATAGVHPHEATTWSPQVAEQIEHALSDPVVVAVGEAGLDYYYDNSPRDIQRAVFGAQLELAARYRMPIVVHSRDADQDMTAMLRDSDACVVLHSFSSGPELLQAGLDKGYYISFSGMVTFRNWDDAAAVRAVPSDRLLVETDAPYLAPVPHRGKRNEPAFVTQVAAKVAQLRGETADQVARRTTANAARCFGPRIALQADKTGQ
jgi:TatD DNase family protein